MPVTITLPDEFADQFIGHVEALGSPGPGCAVCQVAGLIEKARAALATAPVDGSGAHGVEDEPVLHFCTCKQIDRNYDSRQPIVWNGVQHRYDGRPCHVIAPTRCGGCGHHDDHYPSCPAARSER